MIRASVSAEAGLWPQQLELAELDSHMCPVELGLLCQVSLLLA